MSSKLKKIHVISAKLDYKDLQLFKDFKRDNHISNNSEAIRTLLMNANCNNEEAL